MKNYIGIVAYEDFQCAIAWLFSLVCSAVYKGSHGFASTEARKVNSLLSSSEQLQWEIAWLFTQKTYVLLHEYCPEAYASAGELQMIIPNATVWLQSVASLS